MLWCAHVAVYKCFYSNTGRLTETKKAHIRQSVKHSCVSIIFVLSHEREITREKVIYYPEFRSCTSVNLFCIFHRRSVFCAQMFHVSLDCLFFIDPSVFLKFISLSRYFVYSLARIQILPASDLVFSVQLKGYIVF